MNPMQIKHIFITSVFGLMAAPGVAAAVDIASDAVDASCNSSVLHSTSGSVELEADWALNNYDCGVGKYFDKTTATCLTCTADNYCPGGTFTVESLTNGLNNCPTAYPSSAAGAGAQTDCYRQCTTSDIAHSTEVSGEYYYENNNQCVAESCAVGWNTSPIPGDATPTNSSAVWKYSGSSVSMDPTNNNRYPASYYGLTQPYTYGIDYGEYGAIRGSARLSARTGNSLYYQNNMDTWSATTAELDAAGDGTNCWCRIDGYKPNGGEWEDYAANWVWVHNRDVGIIGCTNSCVAMARNSEHLYAFFNAASNVCNITIRNCDAGYYFDSATATCAKCTANSYCPGGTYNIESESYGINACPTGYGLSAAGASAQTKCYRTCTTADVAHSTEVSGRYYYGDNNMCGPTSCAAGWHINGLNVAKAFETTELTNSGTTTNGYINANGNFNEYTFNRGTAKGQAYYGITEPNTWGVSLDDYRDFGTIRGKAKCSAKGGTSSYSANGTWYSYSLSSKDQWTATTAELTSASGAARYCWCQIDGFRASGSDVWESVEYSTWIYANSLGNSNQCDDQCGGYCNLFILRNTSLRNIFSVVPAASCEPNIIDLDWNPLNGGEHTQNQCTYSESITLPAEPTKAGYTFGGWSVVSGN